MARARKPVMPSADLFHLLVTIGGERQATNKTKPEMKTKTQAENENENENENQSRKRNIKPKTKSQVESEISSWKRNLKLKTKSQVENEISSWKRNLKHAKAKNEDQSKILMPNIWKYSIKSKFKGDNIFVQPGPL
jgi:hypothetical protein